MFISELQDLQQTPPLPSFLAQVFLPCGVNTSLGRSVDEFSCLLAFILVISFTITQAELCILVFPISPKPGTHELWLGPNLALLFM